MITVSALSRNYGALKAVDAVSFEIGKGEVVGLLGHNGAGKTTIMKMITGYLEPTSGVIEVDGLRMGEQTRAIQQRIGYLPENCPVWPEMTVLDYLLFQGELHGLSGEALDAAVARSVRRTALQDKARARIDTLSRGYRQRVGVAQAILHDPEIIILDEPTNGLDPTQILQMRSLIRELADTATVIVSTHILQEVEAVCERVLILRAGALALDARLDQLAGARTLRLCLDNPQAAAYLEAIEGVRAVQRLADEASLVVYQLEAPAELAPEVVRVIAAQGDRIFALQPEVKSLERIFAEINNPGLSDGSLKVAS